MSKEVNDETRVPLRWLLMCFGASVTSFITTVSIGVYVGSFTATTSMALSNQEQGLSKVEARQSEISKEYVASQKQIATDIAEIKTSIKILVEDRRR